MGRSLCNRAAGATCRRSQEATSAGGATTLQGPLKAIPDPDTPYGFAAWNAVEPHTAISTLRRESRYELNMRYAGMHQTNGLYCFEPVTFRWHAFYKGASGAPIADPTGLIVSMLVVGDQEQKFLWGIPLATHATKLVAP